MSNIPKGLAILGSTGSVGTQTLNVLRTFPNHFRVVGLAANRNLSVLQSQVEEFRPTLVSCQGTGGEKAAVLSHRATDCTIEEMVVDPDVDLVVTATAGDVALGPTFTAIEAGKDIALANKETIIMAGELVIRHARQHGVSIRPVDSEPNAIWQCLRGEESGVSKLIITASGGAFRHTKLNDLAKVTPEQALNHPTWKMGPRITVDSATLMNKAFEVIEAHYLFGVPWEKIEVVIHPQSIIHSMVEFDDGSVKAQLSPPDMTLPIQYALFHPDRHHNENISRFDPVATRSLTFEPWEADRYPLFKMALDVGKRGGTWVAALCGADEKAVEMFLSGRMGFLDIGPVIEAVLEDHLNVPDPSLAQITATAEWARDRAAEVVGARQ